MPNPVNHAGKKYGMLTGVRRVGTKCFPAGHKHPIWLFRCYCGNDVEKDTTHVVRGDTKSCGCNRRGKPSYNRLPNGLSSLRGLFRVYMKRSEKKGQSFGLNLEEFVAITNEDCYYCGSKPKQSHKSHKASNGAYLHNGIDRMDNSLGYVHGNIVPCCGRCNRLKNDLSHDDFLEWIWCIYENQNVRLSEEHRAKEAERWIELKALQAAGKISDLRRQVRIPLVVKETLVAHWVADFQYIDSEAPSIDSLVWEDVKSAYTRKLPLYRLKNKLVRAIYGREILET